MPPASYFTVWGPVALYVELYLGMCRALAAPWTGPRRAPDARAGARQSPPAEIRTPIEAPAAELTAATPRGTPQSPVVRASIIPFDEARARLAARRRDDKPADALPGCS